ncbi:MAG: DUF554 domain-containing protein [Bacteroidota bacterium]
MSVRLPLGTFINMATVALGSTIGMALEQSFPPDIKLIVFQAIGLCVLLIGLTMAQKVPEGYLLLLIFSMLLGGITGQGLRLDQWFTRLGDGFQELLGVGGAGFTEGLVTTFLLFCVGSMTIVGAIEEGIQGKRELLLIKSLLDGFTSVALAATYGVGVLFSIIPMLLFQGGITILAGRAQAFFTPKIVGTLSACGGLLILGIGINMLEMASIKVENLLPALLVAAALAYGYQKVEGRRQPGDNATV